MTPAPQGARAMRLLHRGVSLALAGSVEEVELTTDSSDFTDQRIPIREISEIVKSVVKLNRGQTIVWTHLSPWGRLLPCRANCEWRIREPSSNHLRRGYGGTGVMSRVNGTGVIFESNAGRWDFLTSSAESCEKIGFHASAIEGS